MRTITEMEQLCVSGAKDESSSEGESDRKAPSSLAERGMDLCEGMPDDKKVTLTLKHKDSIGVDKTGGSEVEIINFELTCGELREAIERTS